MGELNSDDRYIYYCGQKSLIRNGVALIVNKRVQNAVLGYNLKNDIMISVCTQGKPFNFSFFSITGWGIDLDYCDIERFDLVTSRDHSVVFEIVPKYCISDSFVDYLVCFISTKGFLSTVVDIMVI